MHFDASYGIRQLGYLEQVDLRRGLVPPRVAPSRKAGRIKGQVEQGKSRGPGSVGAVGIAGALLIALLILSSNSLLSMFAWFE